MGSLQSLNSGLLIGTDDVDSFVPEFRSLLVDLTDGVNTLVECFRIFFSFVGEPVSDLVGLEVRLMKKNGRLCGAKCSGRSPFSWPRRPIPGESNG
jgi:hypothetical protein